MSSLGSHTHWLRQFQAGDRAAVQDLWRHYFPRLVGLARAALHDAPRRMADEEDVALSAFDSFCRGLERGRFGDLHDRDNLWRLLVEITHCKTIDHVRREKTQKGGGGRIVELPAADSSSVELPLEQVISREPTPAFAAQVADECRHLLDGLGDAELRTIALWKMEGYTSDEIATKLDCAEITVRRKLRRIRGLWERELES
jgi:DNA-directed RNA polymerase specialized sigma24 family protein